MLFEIKEVVEGTAQLLKAKFFLDLQTSPAQKELARPGALRFLYYHVIDMVIPQYHFELKYFFWLAIVFCGI